MSDDDDARAFWLGGYDIRTGIRTQLSVARAHFNHLAQTEMPEAAQQEERRIWATALSDNAANSVGNAAYHALIGTLAANQEAHFGEPEIPVTDEMIAAGQREQDKHPLGTTGMWSRIYRAMAALAPVELVSAAEDRIAALEAENTKLREDIGYWNETADRLEAEVATWKGIAEKATAAVNDLVARFTMQNAKPEPKTFPAGALKPSKSDPRKMGQ